MLIQTGISIDGTDITKYIAYQGVQWKRNDVDGPNAGRTLSGLMIRDRVSTKIRMDITCRPLYSDELRELLNLLMPEFITVTYDDPMEGVVSKIMYSNNNGAQFMIHKLPKIPEYLQDYPDPVEKEMWHSVTFPLIER